MEDGMTSGPLAIQMQSISVPPYYAAAFIHSRLGGRVQIAIERDTGAGFVRACEFAEPNMEAVAIATRKAFAKVHA